MTGVSQAFSVEHKESLMSFSSCTRPSYLLFPFLAIFLLHCSLRDEQIVSTNEATSACGGFKALAKQKAIYLLPEDTVPCLEETLFWRYDSSSGVLTLALRCISANCAALLSMSVVQDDGRYIIRRQNRQDPNTGAACVCTFDCYCEVPGVTKKTVTVVLDTFSFDFNLADGKGSRVIHPLTYLDLHDVDKSDLAFLSAYPNLRTLSYVDAKKYGDLTPIGSLRSLIGLSCINIDSIGFLSACPQLEHLELQATPGLSDISALGICTSLSDLWLTGIFSVEDLSPVGNCRKLKRLTVKNMAKIVSVSALCSCTELSDLWLSGCASLTTLAPLSALSNLTRLTLDTVPGLSSLEPLRSMTALQWLSITGNETITDLSPLAALDSLKTLHLARLGAVTDYTPLLSCLGANDDFVYEELQVPAAILEQLTRQGVNHKGRSSR
jgi:hypothetical protein